MIWLALLILNNTINETRVILCWLGIGDGDWTCEWNTLT